MTEWHTIPAKFSSEEKKILDILRDVYGLNYNQSIKAGIEFLARFLAIGEYYVMADSDIIKKINRSGKKHMKHLDEDVKKILKKYDRDTPMPLVLNLLLREPRFLSFAKYIF